MENKYDILGLKQSLKDKLMAIVLLETAKDYKEMDCDLVTECVDFLMELEEKQRLTKSEIEQRVNEIPFRGKVTAIGSYTKKKIRAKRLAVIAAVLAVIVALFGIIAIASGNTYSELFRKMGYSLFELLDGGSMEYDNITFIKLGENKSYPSIKELVKNEGIEILYPTWMPENEKITSIWFMNENGADEYILQCSNSLHSISIVSEGDLPEEIKLSCELIETEKYQIFYKENEQFIQADFIYKNNWYKIKSDTKANLFKIIEKLEEVN